MNEKAFPKMFGADGMTLRAYFMGQITPPDDLSLAWGEMMVRPAPRDEKGEIAWSKELVLWWADVYAEFRRVYADAMIQAESK